MKLKIMLFVFLFIAGSWAPAISQEEVKVSEMADLVWLGVDFTAAKFTLVTDEPAVIVNQYLKAINTLIITEVEKYDIKKFFNKPGVTNSIGLVVDRNLEIDPAALVVNNEYAFEDEVAREMIKQYTLTQTSGTALVFIAENLNKVTQTGSYYVCLFNIATREVMECRKMTGKATGFGFRNYWAGSVYNVMKAWGGVK